MLPAWVISFPLGCLLTALVVGMPAVASPVGATLEAEVPGTIERIPRPFSPHWVWVTDLVLERIGLVDLDSGRFLGQVPSGYGTALALFSAKRPELYLPATYFTRRVRGDRSDFLEVWDVETLSPLEEIPLPARRAIDSFALGHAALSDDERFAAVFNWTPATSLSIVDVEARQLASVAPIPGCSLAYAAGDRRFLSLCGDGAAVTVEIGDDGNVLQTARTQPFFDPAGDPLTEKAVRVGDRWHFVSFAGLLHSIDVGDAALDFVEPWSLLTDADREASWQVGGLKHLAAHGATNRLFVLVHPGGPDEHKEPGTEVWVYDLDENQRTARIPLRHPGVSLYGEAVDGEGWPWPLGSLFRWALDAWVPPMVSHIVVTRDAQPLLVTASQFSGSLGVYDANSGEFLRRVQPIGWTSDTLYAPFPAR